jgi:phage shock protein PspC (stress-responsive transcriptional regulator)
MKKNISINISGIIFHIEEDGYEILKKYLDSINKYFASFEDSSEILSDIESRIAEIFLTKLNEGKQIITQEDVHSLIATMGSVADFKAAEEQEYGQAESRGSSYGQTSYQSVSQRKFMRDQKRKILGGVCAGLGHYFNVDPVWIRLLFALLTAGWGFGILVYLVMWIVVPGSYELEEPEVTKKLFRDNERKVLGGVSGGLAAYFGVDIVIVRLLFVVTTIFGGLGLVAYIVLWIVLPAALSITDKMQMQGEPVTLSNIESTVKKSLNVKEGEENVLVKILLFPFRLIGMIITGLGKILYPLVEVIRVAFGIVITFTGLTLIFSLIVTIGILYGLISGMAVPIHLGVPFNEAALPLEAFSRAIPTFTVVAAFFVALIPGIMITLLGISAIAKRIVFNNVVGWFMFFTFFIGVAVLSATIPKIVFDFKEDGDYKIENTYNLNGKTAVLKMNEVGLDEYDVTHLMLKGYDGKEFKLVQNFESQGASRQIAIENAKMVDYHVTVVDTVFTFDSNIQFKEDAIFRGQRLKMTLFVPYDQPFVMDDNIYRLLTNYTDYEQRNGNTWIITKENNIKCVSCPEEPVIEDDQERSSDFSDFNNLEISGLLDLEIQRGDYHSIELIGPEEEKAKYKITQQGGTLIIEYKTREKFDWNIINPLQAEKININIIMPELENLEIKGAGDVEVRDFHENDMDFEILGAIRMVADVQTQDISIILAGASKLDLRGSSNTMDVSVQGASQLRAYDFEVYNAVVEANGASNAKVNVTNRLEMKEGVASKISYRGKPEEVIKD